MTAARHKGQFAFFVICTAFAFALEFKLKTCVDADFECDGSNFCLTCAESLMIVCSFLGESCTFFNTEGPCFMPLKTLADPIK